MAISGSQYKIFTQNRFRFAPVSKLWCGCTLLGSCALIPFRKSRWHFVMAYPSLIRGKQLWKILTSKMFFLDFQAIISGCILMYYLRMIERRFGSRNYANFLLISFVSSLLLEILAFSLIKKFDVLDMPFFASGPYSVLFSCLVQFFLDVPMIPYGYVFNIPVSGKMLPYLLSFQMLLISPRITVSCLCGIATGLLYRNNYSHLNELNLIPESVSDFVYWVLNPLIQFGEEKKGRILPIGATLEAQRQEIMDRFEQRLIFEQMRFQNSQDGAAGVPFIQRLFGNNPMELPPVEVSEANIQILMDMGFTDRDRVTQALRGSNNDVSNAANFLLHSSSS